MLCRVRAQPELGEDARHVLLDGRLADEQGAGNAAVRLAFGHRGEDRQLARCQLLERVVGAPPAEHHRHDISVESRSAAGNSLDRVDERVDVPDPLLEQVTDPRGLIPDEGEHVLLLGVLGEDEDACVWTLAAQFQRGVETVVLIAGRHLDIGQRHIGPVRESLAQQIVRIAGLSDDLDPGVLEQAADSSPQQDIVLTDNHAQSRCHSATVTPGLAHGEQCLKPGVRQFLLRHEGLGARALSQFVGYRIWVG